jgi:hypothetical protein
MCQKGADTVAEFNGYCCRIQCASLASLETLVFASGLPCIKFIVRKRLMPVAVATS